MERNNNGNKPLYIADTARIIGDVHFGKDVNVWFGAVLRGDIAHIEIGDGTNIQENAVIHVDYNAPCIIGSRVTVGHSAIVHGAKICDDVLVGMGSIILTGAEIGEGCVIAAGAVVKENEKILPFSLVAGVPGKIVKNLSKDIIEKIRRSSEEYIKLAKRRLSENS